MKAQLHMSKRSLLATSVCLSIATAVTGANAQWVSGSDPVLSRTIEEIVITARRRDESAQRVPISIGAYGPDELERRSVESLEDLSTAALSIH